MSIYDINGEDEIEVVDEVDGMVYVFTGTKYATADDLIDRWAMDGDQTWRTCYATRLATVTTLAPAPTFDDLGLLLAA